MLLIPVSFTTKGYHALPEKKSFFANNTQHENNIAEKHENITISNYKTETTEKNSLEFNESFNINYEAEKIGDNYYLDPFIYKFFEENPFKLQERTYPTDFGYKDTYLYTLKIQIDDKYDIIEKPVDLSICNTASDAIKLKLLHRFKCENVPNKGIEKANMPPLDN